MQAVSVVLISPYFPINVFVLSILGYVTAFQQDVMISIDLQDFYRKIPIKKITT